jgi:hypothetical protein
MLAPIDKLRSGQNRIMQIEVTRKCDLSCSNCTRLLPYRKDTWEMSLDVFRQAVWSLDGWAERGGIVAMFGGNPCTHSRFPELCAILSDLVPPENRGLWSNNLMKHGAVAAETFREGVLNLNAHGIARAAAGIEAYFPARLIAGSDKNASWHAAILADYRDLGLSMAEWVEKREQCDINQKWSGIIQEFDGAPYGYFCEIAGAMDGVTGDRNGVLARPGWWSETIDGFGHQIKNCCDRGCGVPLKLKGHKDLEYIYDTTGAWKDIVKPQGRVGVEYHYTAPETTYETTDYLAFRGVK